MDQLLIEPRRAERYDLAIDRQIRPQLNARLAQTSCVVSPSPLDQVFRDAPDTFRKPLDDTRAAQCLQSSDVPLNDAMRTVIRNRACSKTSY